MSVVDRFVGEEAERLRLESLPAHALVQGSAEIAAELLAVAEVRGFAPGRVVMEQDAAENDLYLILAGSVSILVNGQEIANRTLGQRVGEMAVVDPAAVQSVTGCRPRGVRDTQNP